MMSEEQSKVVKLVYSRLIESEEGVWTDIDENLLFYDWLDDKELITESHIKHEKHSRGVFRCSQKHNQENCVAPLILESVEAILKLYRETSQLHIKNRYILVYYLVMTEMGMIFLANESA